MLPKISDGFVFKLKTDSWYFGFDLKSEFKILLFGIEGLNLNFVNQITHRPKINK